MILEIDKIQTYYDLSHILFNISININEGEVICLLGRNGVGKTTILRSIMGLTPPRSGNIRFKDTDITHTPTYMISRMGIGLVPEDRRIFPDLTVRENLQVSIKGTTKLWTLEKIFDLFPVLKERETQGGGELSGGEQQMLAIARALLGNPELLLLDEPTEGLAPLVVRTLGDQLEKLKISGLTMILTEHGEALASRLGTKAYLIEKGKNVWEGTMEELNADAEARIKYLGV
jgi:branched-chain amino acid transport system ATP-binding protein